MTHRFASASAVLLLLTICGWTSKVIAEEAAKETTPAAAPAAGARPAASTPAATPASAASKYPPFAEVTKDADTIDGVIKLYRKGSHLFAELTGGVLNRDFIVLISLAKGIGQEPLWGGMSWSFGDDWIWQFRKADDRIHLVRRNVRFTAAKGDPQEKAVNLAYTDSVLFSLPIATMGPAGGYVVDLSHVFMGDLPQISSVLPGFSFSENKSTYAAVKGFPDNIEVEVAATYSSSGSQNIDSVADSRGATINVHYSISSLPSTGYQPRLADDRVGYFVTAVKDYSRKSDDDRFLRYINRWDLRKADSAAELSPPKNPIKFYLEKTIPYAYRKPIREGIEEWNKAFEKAGFVNAIEVRQQEDKDDWDPEDIRYNTFRWITASPAFAMGMSRVNPTTGQILDADIIFSADFLKSWNQEYENFTEASIARMTGGPLDLQSYQEAVKHEGHFHGAICELHHGLARELALGSAILVTRKANPADHEKMLVQGLKEVAMHEVGHTLGLRHNFKASSFLSLEELNDPQKTKDTGLTASVMDYAPTNLMPNGATQGDFFSSTIGPYDKWAIEYGYKPLSGGTEGEVTELKKIASRGTEPGLAYATDEDTRGIDPDPLANRFDLGNDPIAYAKLRAQLISEQWPKVLEETAKSGDSYQKVRQVFGTLLKAHATAMHMASRYIGGMYVNRAHKGDANGKAPFIVVDAAKQREALTLLEDQVFSDKPFQFPPDLYNYLVATRWEHWGTELPSRTDYPVHEVISMWQNRILQQLLSSLTLDRLHDSELHVPADQDALTTAELLGRLTKTIFGEVDKLPEADYTNRKPAISSLRRNLQRSYLKQLSQLALGNSRAPQDCQTIAYAELGALEGRINNLLKTNTKLDAYSRAHLEESAARIHKVIDARLTLYAP